MSEVLAVDELCARYGDSQALHGMTFTVGEGEIVALLGRNGAGKSTTLKAIIGTMRARSGSVVLNGQQTIGLKPHQIARLGVAHCPEERGIFSGLTVLENLLLPPKLDPGGMEPEEIYELFPNLKERLSSSGTHLSGGEQQMLAIARTLRTGARFLMFDEPSEGIAPIIVEKIRETIQTIKSRGYTILLVEQNLAFATSLADRHYVVETGRIVDSLSRDEISASHDRLHQYLAA